MKPKLLHWYLIGWIDADPCIALCLCVRNGDGRYGRSRSTEEIDSTSQILRDLGRIRIPTPHHTPTVRIKP